jgi:HK97 gp10 family phage protein
MDDTIRIRGGKELGQFLQSLPLKIEKNIMRAALRAGAGVIAKEAKKNVPIKYGKLKKSIRTGSNAKKGHVEAYLLAGGRSSKAGKDKSAFYATFVEFGTAAHIIKGKDGGMLRFVAKDGKTIKTPQVSHPGAVAKPYMRPALDSKANEAVDAVAQKIRERLTKEGINNVAPEGSD